jgi:hypothetical protein
MIVFSLKIIQLLVSRDVSHMLTYISLENQYFIFYDSIEISVNHIILNLFDFILNSYIHIYHVLYNKFLYLLLG